MNCRNADQSGCIPHSHSFNHCGSGHHSSPFSFSHHHQHSMLQSFSNRRIHTTQNYYRQNTNAMFDQTVDI